MNHPSDSAANLDSREEAPVPSPHGGPYAPDLIRLLVQSVRDYAIFVLDKNGVVASWNEGAQRIKGWSANEIIGRHFSTFYPVSDVIADKPGMELRVAAAVGRFEDEGWRVRKDGSRFWANVVITALHDETGELVGFAKVSRDLTERRAAEDRAIDDARRVAEAEASNRAKSEFLAMLSHELRTPLNAIAGFTELLELEIGGSITDTQRVYLGRIHASEHHLLGLVNDLLNYSRVEQGRLTYDIVEVPVLATVTNMIPLVEQKAAAKQIDLRVERCDESVTARADLLKLEQIILNLLGNAVKFTPSGGRITIRCGATADTVTIAVEDNGPGIALEKQAEIFEPFVQLGRTYVSSHEGAGLGLAISRELARAMHGEVAVESTPGEGSRFVLTLPRRADDAAAGTARA